MKTLGRIVIILAIFAMVSGLMIIAVNAGGTTGSAPAFGRPDGFQPGGDFAQGERHERGEEGGAGWMFGLIKNVGVIGMITTMIVWPKSIKKAKRKASIAQAHEAS